MTPTLTPSTPNAASGVRLHTEADLAAMPDQLPSGPVKWELHHGRLVSMVLPSGRHGFYQTRIGFHLTNQGDLQGHGETHGEIGVVLGRNPDHIVGPDVCFIRASRLPPAYSPEEYFETVPDLCVEVRSKNDTLAELQRKAGDYLAAGAVAVWVVNPVAQEVIESRQGGQRVFGPDDTLTLDDIIPGFSLPVRNVFA